MGRLLTIREGPNNRQGWDGARGILKCATGRSMASMPWASKTGSMSSTIRPTTTSMIWGLYATTMLDVLPGSGIDVYYMGDAVKKAFWTRTKSGYFQDFVLGIADEVRHSVGIRLFGGRGQLDWDMEAIVQGGDAQQ